MYKIPAKHLPFVFLFKKEKNKNKQKSLEKLYSEMTIPTKEESGEFRFSSLSLTV